MWACAFAVVAGLSGPAAEAAAQSAVDRGVASYEAGEFEAALQAFAEAEEGDSLRRDELVRLLSTRALLYFAEDRSEAMLRDLRALASLEPQYDLGPRAPPAVREAFDRARARAAEGLRLDVRARSSDDGVQVTARPAGDGAGLVRSIELSVRPPEGSWQRSRSGEVTLAVTGLDWVEYAAAALGPGQAVLVRRGTETLPQRLVLRPSDAGGSGDGGPDLGLLLGLGLGGAALVAAVVVVAVVVAAGSGGDRLAPPQIEWP